MKVVAAVLVTLLLGAGAAEAGWVPSKKLPKPIDYPVVRPRLKEVHKPGKRANHPPSVTYRVVAANTANT